MGPAAAEALRARSAAPEPALSFSPERPKKAAASTSPRLPEPDRSGEGFAAGALALGSVSSSSLPSVLPGESASAAAAPAPPPEGEEPLEDSLTLSEDLPSELCAPSPQDLRAVEALPSYAQASADSSAGTPQEGPGGSDAKAAQAAPESGSRSPFADIFAFGGEDGDADLAKLPSWMRSPPRAWDGFSAADAGAEAPALHLPRRSAAEPQDLRAPGLASPQRAARPLPRGSHLSASQGSDAQPQGARSPAPAAREAAGRAATGGSVGAPPEAPSEELAALREIVRAQEKVILGGDGGSSGARMVRAWREKVFEVLVRSEALEAENARLRRRASRGDAARRLRDVEERDGMWAQRVKLLEAELSRQRAALRKKGGELEAERAHRRRVQKAGECLARQLHTVRDGAVAAKEWLGKEGGAAEGGVAAGAQRLLQMEARLRASARKLETLSAALAHKEVRLRNAAAAAETDRRLWNAERRKEEVAALVTFCDRMLSSASGAKEESSQKAAKDGPKDGPKDLPKDRPARRAARRLRLLAEGKGSAIAESKALGVGAGRGLVAAAAPGLAGVLPECELAMRGVFLSVDRACSGGAPRGKVPLARLVEALRRTPVLGKLARGWVGRRAWAQALEALDALCERHAAGGGGAYDVTWGEFLLLFLPEVQSAEPSPAQALLRLKAEESARRKGRWDAAGPEDAAMQRDLALEGLCLRLHAPAAQADSGAAQFAAMGESALRKECLRLCAERAFLLRRLGEDATWMARREEATAGAFRWELLRSSQRIEDLREELSSAAGEAKAQHRRAESAEAHALRSREEDADARLEAQAKVDALRQQLAEERHRHAAAVRRGEGDTRERERKQEALASLLRRDVARLQVSLRQAQRDAQGLRRAAAKESASAEALREKDAAIARLKGERDAALRALQEAQRDAERRRQRERPRVSSAELRGEVQRREERRVKAIRRIAAGNAAAHGRTKRRALQQRYAARRAPTAPLIHEAMPAIARARRLRELEGLAEELLAASA